MIKLMCSKKIKLTQQNKAKAEDFSVSILCLIMELYREIKKMEYSL